MKRLAVLLLALLYLAAGAGFTMRTHYCMGEQVSTSISHPIQEAGNHHCPYCGMEQKGHKGCCHDELKFFKCCTDQVPAEMPQLSLTSPAACTSTAFQDFRNGDFIPTTAAPAPLRPKAGFAEGPPLYLRLQRLLI